MVASTVKGQQSALASPNERFVLTLRNTGMLSITERATNATLFSVGPFRGCLAPYRLMSLPNGLLALQDKAGTNLWTTTSACRGTPTCYTYQLLNDGQLVVKDAEGTVTWSSATEGGSSSGQQAGWLYQITSGGQSPVSCLFSGPSPRAAKLVSRDQSMSLQIAQANGALAVRDAIGNVIWSPTNALTGRAPAQLCITKAARLNLTSASPPVLWTSTTVLPPDAAAPYTAEVTNDGCLDILDGRCQLVWSSHDFEAKKAGKPPALASKAGRLPPPKPAASASNLSGAAGSPSPRVLPGGFGFGSGNGTTAARKRPGAKLPLVKALRPPPKPAAVTSSSAAKQTCSLQAEVVCGGISLCGVDSRCVTQGCCSSGLVCLRKSQYTWICG